MKNNRLNNLNGKEWIKFQKSWFVLNPAPRQKDVLVHPAKFPEKLVEEFIKFFTKSGGVVLDPMAGTGSTLLACIASGRVGIGIELSEKYAKVAKRRIDEAPWPDAGAKSGERTKSELSPLLLEGDARELERFDLPEIDYCITSPPYWDMLNVKGAKTQRDRAKAGLDVSYSQDERDFGNIEDYGKFLDEIVSVFAKVHDVLKERAYLTIIVKNIKKKGKIYPLAWDLGKRLGEIFALKDEKIWCQDDQRLAPFGMGSAWVSNTFHHYCLNFRKE